MRVIIVLLSNPHFTQDDPYHRVTAMRRFGRPEASHKHLEDSYARRQAKLDTELRDRLMP